MTPPTFGEALRSCRIENGLSQEELAFRAGLHRTYISQLERGMKSPSLETIGRIAKALKLTPSALIEKTERTHK